MSDQTTFAENEVASEEDLSQFLSNQAASTPATKTPKVPKAKAPKAEKPPKEPKAPVDPSTFGLCKCGCGSIKKSASANFLPGHDAKAKSVLQKADRAKADPNSESKPEVPEILMGYAKSNDTWRAWYPNLFAVAE